VGELERGKSLKKKMRRRRAIYDLGTPGKGTAAKVNSLEKEKTEN